MMSLPFIGYSIISFSHCGRKCSSMCASVYGHGILHHVQYTSDVLHHLLLSHTVLAGYYNSHSSRCLVVYPLSLLVINLPLDIKSNAYIMFATVDRF